MTTCHVWWADASTAPALGGLLDRGEQARAARLDSPDRRRFVTAHALARIVLASPTGLHPAAVRLVARCPRCGGAHGKPALPDHPRLAFSISSSGRRVVVALAQAAGVGVDVERLASARVLAAAVDDGATAAVLAPAELAAYQALPERSRHGALLRWWTRKEAILKATGDGLAVDPAAVELSAPGAPPALTGWSGPGPAPRVRLVDLDAGPGYAAALAVLGSADVSVVEHDAGPVLRAAAAARRTGPASGRRPRDGLR
ncbi:4'-phosphopantetheinyl transferase family protein [Georgenia thermotolerans]|uniref:4'-phosphopantetheinyl transferase family protein n=1 Tax=Georgenia thermotolerans TaxID=527326 RepID=UPI001479588E|nr:4'-phosphopantetheinyl transferase superfamily protein [Georgenia thermotolerans]